MYYNEGSSQIERDMVGVLHLLLVGLVVELISSPTLYYHTHTSLM